MCDALETFALELGGKLSGAPGVELDFADRVLPGEVADGLGGLEYGVVAVADPDAGAEVLGDPGDGGSGPLPADVDVG
jgi:hypothetical protein